MDNARGFEEDRSGLTAPDDGADDAIGSAAETRAPVGGDERRMHVRAYNHWVSLLGGAPFPSITSLDPAGIADFGAHSVLLDFTRGEDDPAIAYLGRALRDECGIDRAVARISDVPGRSLLSRLTDHYRQILANRAPVGFEAEFVGTRGTTMMYRGILMPFSSDGERIDFIYGVINWKELVDAATQQRLDNEVDAALKAAPAPAPAATVWADGPGALDAEPQPVHAPIPAPAFADDTLDDRLAQARAAAAEAQDADGRSRGALYAALGRAHDFALAAANDPEGYTALRTAAGVAVQARAPMTAVAKLVFGAEAPKARLTEFAAVLAHAERTGVPGGTLAQYLNATAGGMKAIVAAERAARRGPAPAAPTTDALDTRAALATVRLPVSVSAGYVLLLGRIAGDAVEIVADVSDPAPLARAVAKAARQTG